MKTEILKNKKGVNHKIKVYDNGGKSIDRYSVYFLDCIEKEEHGKKFYQVLAMNENPTHPQGFGQHCSGMIGKHNGKRIAFSNLPKNCQNCVVNDINLEY